jgi:hypothetical protein
VALEGESGLSEELEEALGLAAGQIRDKVRNARRDEGIEGLEPPGQFIPPVPPKEFIAPIAG